MSEEQTPWFVVERSEALAALLLTDQSGVEVVSRQRREDGVDLLVGLSEEGPLTTRLFAVQVRGTLSADPANWMASIRHLFRGTSGLHYLPTCAFVVNVRDDTIRSAWIAEPFAEADRAVLKFHQSPTFEPLDETTVSEFLGRVKTFYDSMPRQMMATA